MANINWAVNQIALTTGQITAFNAAIGAFRSALSR